MKETDTSADTATFENGNWIEGTGMFHQFGLDTIESNEGNVSFSTAIIETDTGIIYNVPVEYVSFLDSEKVY